MTVTVPVRIVDNAFASTPNVTGAELVPPGLTCIQPAFAVALHPHPKALNAAEPLPPEEPNAKESGDSAAAEQEVAFCVTVYAGNTTSAPNELRIWMEPVRGPPAFPSTV
jgi:hypothetical protein